MEGEEEDEVGTCPCENERNKREDRGRVCQGENMLKETISSRETENNNNNNKKTAAEELAL